MARSILTIAFFSMACAGGAGSTRYSGEGDQCSEDADCTFEPDDEVVAALCHDGECRGVRSIEHERADHADCTDGRSCFTKGLELYDDAEYAAATALFVRACDRGYGRGCHVAGNMYRLGSGVHADPARARAYYEMVCDDKTYPEACFNLSLLDEQ